MTYYPSAMALLPAQRRGPDGTQDVMVGQLIFRLASEET